MKPDFSRRHPYSEADVQAVVQATKKEDRRNKWLLTPSPSHRACAMRAFVASQVAYLLANASILISELMSHQKGLPLISVWSLEVIVNWAVRMCLYRIVFSATPLQAQGILRLRLIPTAIAIIAVTHWIWTGWLFIGAAWSLGVLVVFLALIAVSITALAYWVISPLSAIINVPFMWIALLGHCVATGIFPLQSLPVVVAGIGILLFASVFPVVAQLDPLLERSDTVDLLVAKLERINVRTTQTIERRTRFLGHASHDFGQRLHALQALSLSSVLCLPPNAASRSILVRVSEEISELEGYISRILEFTREEILDHTPQIEELHLFGVFQKLDLSFGSLAHSRGVELTFRATHAVIRTDPAMLQRVLENLLSNALRFTRKRVLIAARRRGAELVLEVWDQGPGIAEDRLPLLFEAFNQDGGNDTRQGGRGPGLGLALVRLFADRLGHRVSVLTRRGHGTVFRIGIPAAWVVRFDEGARSE